MHITCVSTDCLGQVEFFQIFSHSNMWDYLWQQFHPRVDLKGQLQQLRADASEKGTKAIRIHFTANKHLYPGLRGCHRLLIWNYSDCNSVICAFNMCTLFYYRYLFFFVSKCIWPMQGKNLEEKNMQMQHWPMQQMVLERSVYWENNNVLALVMQPNSDIC